MGRRIDLTGKKFGRLTVIGQAESYVEPSGRKQIMYRCKCECGNECVVRGTNLSNGHTKSCGCYQREVRADPLSSRSLPNKYYTEDGHGVCLASNTGEKILFDLDDFQKIKDYRWYITRPNQRDYKNVTGNVNGKSWLMHRYLMQDQLSDGVFIDHINRDALDNRRSNLRLCTIRENSCNLKPKNRLGVKGVCFITRNKFEVKIQDVDKRLHLGVFDTMKEATDVYDAKAKELFGDFAYLNNYKGVKVISMNDGLSSGMIALKSIYGAVDEYHAYEKNEYAVGTVLLNYPEIIQHGDIADESFERYEGTEIDYLIGKSSSLDFRIRAFFGRTIVKGDGAIEFQHFLRAVDVVKPHFIIYEISSSASSQAVEWISCSLGFKPVIINSEIVSAHARKKYYWVGIRDSDGSYRSAEIIKTKDKKIKLKDVIDGETDRDKARSLAYSRMNSLNSYFVQSVGNLVFEPVDTLIETGDLPIVRVDNGIAYFGDKEKPIKMADGIYVARNLDVDECKRLQNIPESYKFPTNDIRALRLLASASTVEVLRILIYSILRNQ